MSYSSEEIKIRQKVDKYLSENDIDRTEKDCYKKISQKLGNVSADYVRTRHRSLRRKEKNKEFVEDVSVAVAERLQEGYRKFKNGEHGGDLEFITKKRIKTKEDLIEVAEIDITKWNIISYEVTTWEGYRKDKKVNLEWEKGIATGFVDDKGKLVTETLYRVNIKLSPRKMDNDLGLQKAALIDELRAYSPIVKSKFSYISEERSCLLEICVHDLHLGSLSWGEESGEDYDLKIAEKRFKDSVNELLKRVNLSQVEKILLPIGNDLMNIDNKNNATVNGTVVDTDCRFMKMIKVARRIVIEVIDELALIAPVDIVIVPGNHDSTVSFMLGEILDAFYFNNENVTVFNSPKPRKYYRYGLVGLQLTHGDEEKHEALGMIFANQEPNIWASTKYRFCQLGHFHKNKKINYVSVDEHPGFQIQILPTLSSATAWADKKGYSSLKQAKAFLFDKEKGQIGEFTTTI